LTTMLVFAPGSKDESDSAETIPKLESKAD